MWLFFVYSPGNRPGAEGPRATRRILKLECIWSDDDGKTWSERRSIGTEVDRPEWIQLWSSPGRGVQTTKGRLIIPCTARVPETYDMGSFLTYSDDHGKTWQVGPCAGWHINEPALVELQDGTLLINARSQRGKGCRATVRSSDGGQTWSDIEDIPVLIEPNCQGSIIRYGGARSSARSDGRRDSQRLIFSNPAASERGDRRNMTVRCSPDAGNTWPYSRQIYPGPSRYSCLTVLPDGDIGLLYEKDSFTFEDKDNANKKISFTRFPLSWLMGDDATQ